ncbi:hypothetical protein [Hyphomicrobium sp. MC8b]|uniref:hypothetical protein n=1 Tax=Hyphomicrobium sp. MC8b TaxID=300273 RepID=UPI00391BFB1E
MTYVYALVSLGSLAFIWYYIFWLYRDFRIDQFRQQMFCLRDELFDNVVDGDLSFDDEAYGTLRVTMNGFIRFAHVLSLSNVLAASFWMHEEGVSIPNQKERLDRSLAELPKEKRDKYAEYRLRMHRIVLRHLLLSSPVSLITIVIPASCFFLAAAILERATVAARLQLERIDSVAYVAADPN